VIVNVALTNASSGSSAAPNFIYAYPAGSPPSTAIANQNYVAGETLSSKIIVGVGNGGAITLANHSGSVDLVVDIDGYFAASGSAGPTLHLLSSPVRISGANGTLVGGGQTTSVSLQGTSAVAGILNVAEVYQAATGGNFLTVYPSGASAPTAADLNFTQGDVSNTLSNASYADASSSGGVTVLNGPSSAGNSLVFIDEFGYFS